MTTRQRNTQKKNSKKSQKITEKKQDELLKNEPKTVWRPYPFKQIYISNSKENWEKIVQLVNKLSLVTRKDIMTHCNISDGKTLYNAMKKANVKSLSVIKTDNNQMINLYGFAK